MSYKCYYTSLFHTATCTNLRKCDFSPLQLHAVGVTHVPIIPASPSVTQLLPSPLAVARDHGLSPCFKYVDSSDILTLFRR